jgi:ribosomal protein L34E
MLVIPYWFGLLLVSILPALWLVHWRRRRALPEHACVKCGYDLQGTLAAGRSECPECGQTIEAVAKA